MIPAPSATETALSALAATLSDALAAIGWPALSRNEVLDVLLEALGEGAAALVNLIDGNKDDNESDEALGADTDSDGYTIVHNWELEILLQQPDAAARDTAFDQALVTVADAIAADRTLGGVVSDCRLLSIERSNPRTDGLPGVKFALVTGTLTFMSNRIF